MGHFEGDVQSPVSARYAIVASRWNPRITDALLAGAQATFAANGIAADAVDVIRVAGAWELPVTAAHLVDTGGYAALVALGCVVRGETRHFEQIADECARGLMRVAVDSGIPIANGVLAVEQFADAQARAGGSQGNKGEEAALVAIEMANLFGKLA